ncbi:MAG: transposase [Magnetococcales bacterium]|nr:transposase [Magnetococcales bacterium]
MNLPADIWLTAAQLAGLPGLPGSPRGIKLYLERNGIDGRKRAKGKGLEYPLVKLPADARAAYELQQIGVENLPVPTNQSRVLVPVAELKSWQRRVMDARLVILREVDLQAETSSRREALQAVVEMAAIELLPESVQSAIPVALGKNKKGKNMLSVRTIQRWQADLKKGLSALAPRSMESLAPPVWVLHFMKFYRDRRQPSVRDSLADLKESGYSQVPEYHQVSRYLRKIGMVERSKSRLSRSALKAICPNMRRDFMMLEPMDVINGDGYTFPTWFRHPDTGKAFQPEVTEIFDVRTRYHVGWSINYSENKHAVMDSIRMAVECGGPSGSPGGIPAIVQWDNGSGAKNKAMADEVTGLKNRLGFDLYHQLPGNPQAGGIVERGHRQVLLPTAKSFFTYIGKQKSDAHLRREVEKRLKDGRIQLPPLEELAERIEKYRERYNNNPHSSLPKIIDPITRKRRHQTPTEAWQECVLKGWKPVVVEDALAEFRLEEVGTVRRGQIRFHNMIYASGVLRGYNDQKVRVRYDPRDGSKVWVWSLGSEDQFICEAAKDRNLVPYLADNMLGQGKQKREAAQIRRKENDIERIKAEARSTLDLTAEPEPLTPSQQIAADEYAEEIGFGDDADVIPLRPEPQPGERPIFNGPTAEMDWGKWAIANPELLDEEERMDLEEKLDDPHFRRMVGVDEDQKKTAG